MKRKILSILLALALVFFPLQNIAFAIYSDIEENWAKSAINKWSDFGIIKGSDGKFSPDEPITRGDLAVIIDRIMKYQKEAKNEFSDLGQAYYTSAILKANAAGVMLGSNGYLRPNDSITREEAVVVLGRALSITERTNAIILFNDYFKISPWAVGFVNALAANGIIRGFDNRFNPKASITRAEVVTILNNAISAIENIAKVYTGDVTGTVIVNTSGVVLSDMKVNGDLIISEGVGNGEVTLNNVTITGNTIVRGGGADSIHITGNSHISRFIIEKTDEGTIRVLKTDGTLVDAVVVDDGNDSVILTGIFESVIISSDVLVLAVDAIIKSVTITSPNSIFNIEAHSILNNLKVTDIASDSTINVTGTVNSINTDSKIFVQNNGTINYIYVNANNVIINGTEPETVNVSESVYRGPTDFSGKAVLGKSYIRKSSTDTVDAEVPEINYELTNVVTSIGTAVTLDATSTVTDGGVLTYEWYSNVIASTAGGAELGVKKPTYQPDVSSAGITYYFCVITNTNNSATGAKTATKTSAVAKVKVNALADAVT